MSEAEQEPSVTVREFVKAPDLGLELELLGQHDGLDHRIRSARIQKLGLALAGFNAYLHPHRVQILGGSESNYLASLDPGGRKKAILHLFGRRICCIVITRGLPAAPELAELARSESIPILRSPELSSTTISRITRYLEQRLAPRMTVHGVFLDVFGIGVLLTGPSGIGKSECALELVLKGHRLVADDAVIITKSSLDHLMAEAGEVLKHHIELRGLGILDVGELFGVSATSNSQNLDLVVSLERWKLDSEYDRVGFEQSRMEYLGVSVPCIEMPVAPGRNIATLVEVAARLHLLRRRGYLPNRKVLERFPTSSTEQGGADPR